MSPSQLQSQVHLQAQFQDNFAQLPIGTSLASMTPGTLLWILRESMIPQLSSCMELEIAINIIFHISLTSMLLH
jgi:hypothetical protein